MNKHTFQLESDLVLNRNLEHFLSPKRVELLEKISVYGSISKAAKASGVTYKTAWDWLEKMNRLSPQPLVRKVSGGKDGGGTILTLYAKELMQRFEQVYALHQKHLRSLETSFEIHENEENEHFSYSRLSGVIVSMSLVERYGSVGLEIAPNKQVKIEVPHSFFEAHKVKVGDKAEALIEAEAVSISQVLQADSSQQNQFNGKVHGVYKEKDSVLVDVYIAPEKLLRSRITRSSYEKMGIHEGDTILTLFKAYSATLFCKEITQ
jgi:molybdate transport system regulatory protein